MKKKKEFNSIADIKLARERLKYENKFYQKRLKTSGSTTVPSLSLSVRNLKYTIRKNLFTFAVFKALIKSNIIYFMAGRVSRLVRKGLR